MEKTRKITIILTLAVAFCFVFVSLAQADDPVGDKNVIGRCQLDRTYIPPAAFVPFSSDERWTFGPDAEALFGLNLIEPTSFVAAVHPAPCMKLKAITMSVYDSNPEDDLCVTLYRKRDLNGFPEALATLCSEGSFDEQRVFDVQIPDSPRVQPGDLYWVWMHVSPETGFRGAIISQSRR